MSAFHRCGEPLTGEERTCPRCEGEIHASDVDGLPPNPIIAAAAYHQGKRAVLHAERVLAADHNEPDAAFAGIREVPVVGNLYHVLQPEPLG